MKYLAVVEGKSFEVDFRDNGEIWMNGEKSRLDVNSIDNLDLYSVLHNNTSYEVFAEEEAGQYYRIQVHGETFAVDVKDAIGARLQGRLAQAVCSTGDVAIVAPIPGMVVGIPVETGQQVAGGQVVVVIESMKMQNELKAPCAGVVKRVPISPQQVVDVGQELMVIGAPANG